MILEGLVDEAYNVYNIKNKNHSVMRAIGYKELFTYFDGFVSLDEAISEIKKNSRHYAKRQYTFFKNQFDDIRWINVDEIDIFDLIRDI